MGKVLFPMTGLMGGRFGAEYYESTARLKYICGARVKSYSLSFTAFNA
jgi:hypothetical protein